MPKLKIRDIAVLANFNATPRRIYGEAPDKDDVYTELTPEERANTVTRLQSSIFSLMDNAAQTHNEHLQNTTDSSEADNYITRLSTHEFFFYTKAPLSLDEFEQLQEQILRKATNLPSGVHLALGSFAVEIPGQGVMNVTPFIMCGDPADAKFIVKNHTSSIDVSYQDGLGVTISPLEKRNYTNNSQSITLRGNTYSLSLDNIVHCITPGGEPFLTTVDICIDHLRDISRQNLSTITKSQPEKLRQPISQIVISNTVDLATYACIGEVMHTDPRNSTTLFDRIGIESSNELTLPFGTENPRVQTLRPVEQQSLEEALLENQSRICTILDEKKNEHLQTIANSTSIIKKLPEFEALVTQEGNHSALEDIKMLQEFHNKQITDSQAILDKIVKLEKLIERLNSLQLSDDDQMMLVYINKQIVDFCKERQSHLINSVLIGIELDIADLEEIADKLQNYNNNHLIVSDTQRVEMLKIKTKYCSATSVRDRLALLNEIKEVQNKAIQSKLEDIKQLIPGVTGKYLSSKLELRFMQANTEAEKIQIIENANKLCNNHKLITHLFSLVENYYTKSNDIFSIGMEKKGDRILNALQEMSIDDYCNLHNLNDEHPLFEALASRRYLGGTVSRTRDGKIDHNKAATIFKDFKMKVQKINDNIQPDADDVKDDETKNTFKG